MAIHDTLQAHFEVALRKPRYKWQQFLSFSGDSAGSTQASDTRDEKLLNICPESAELYPKSLPSTRS